MQKMYIRARAFLADLPDREEGQGLVEYALILGAIAVGAAIILTQIGEWVETTLTAVKEAL